MINLREGEKRDVAVLVSRTRGTGAITLTSPERRIHDHLPLEVGFKVCDTVTGLIGVYRQGNPKPSGLFSSFGNALMDAGSTIEVLLWLEDPVAPPGTAEDMHSKARLSTVTKQLKKYCSWLTENVIVVNSREFKGTLPDVSVRP